MLYWLCNGSYKQETQVQVHSQTMKKADDNRHLTKRYEHRYEQSATYPVQCFVEEWIAP